MIFDGLGRTQPSTKAKQKMEFQNQAKWTLSERPCPYLQIAFCLGEL